jgi:hypothetical protein
VISSLAPDIVELILEGRQPHDLNFEKLSKRVPLSWAEQRVQFLHRQQDAVCQAPSSPTSLLQLPITEVDQAYDQ